MKSTAIILLTLIISSPAQAQSEAWPWVQDGPEVVSILLIGDTNIQLRERPEEAFQYVMPTLDAADLRIMNLEGPFAGASDDPLVPDIPHKDWRHSEPDQVRALTAANIDVVGVANNVTYPWQALMRSLGVLDEAGIPYAGGGEDLEAAHEPVILEKDGLRIGFMQYAATVFPFNHAATENRPGIAEIKVHTAYKPPPQLDKPGQPPIVITWLDEASKARMVDDIRRLDEQADIVIVSYHWGVSGTREPVSYQSDIARAVIDAGADVVFGHGPHRCLRRLGVARLPELLGRGRRPPDRERLGGWALGRRALDPHEGPRADRPARVRRSPKGPVSAIQGRATRAAGHRGWRGHGAITRSHLASGRQRGSALRPERRQGARAIRLPQISE